VRPHGPVAAAGFAVQNNPLLVLLPLAEMLLLLLLLLASGI
jgi:hypothetical protein